MTDEEQLKILITARNTAKKAFDEANAQLNQLQGNQKSITDKMNEFGGAMRSAGAKLTLGLTLPLAYLGKQMFSSAADFEQLQIAMETMLGSADRARKLLADLDALAVKTPFQITEVQQAARQMLAYGIEADKVVETTRMLGDVSAGLGIQTFPQLTLAFGQIKAKGKLMGQELLQLTNAGFNLAEAMGVSRSELMEMMETGDGVTFEQVEQAFIRATSEGGRFHNMMQNQSQTTSGKISNLKDEITRLLREMGKNLLPIAQNIVKVFKSIAEWFGKLSKDQQKWIVYIGLAVAAIGPLLTMLGSLVSAFALLASPIGIVVAVIGALIAAFALFYTKNEGFRDFINAIGKKIKDTWEDVYPVLRKLGEEIIPKVKEAFQEVKDKVKVFLDGIKDVYNFLKPKIQPIFEKLKNTIKENLIPALKKAYETFKKDVLPVLKQIYDILEPLLIPALKTFGIIVGVTLLSTLITFATTLQLGAKWLSIWLDTMSRLVSYISNEVTNTIAFFTNIVQGLQQIISTVIGLIKSVFESLKTTFLETVSNISNKLNELARKFQEVFGWNPITMIRQIWEQVIGFFLEVRTRIVNALGDAKDWLFNVGRDIILGFASGVLSMFNRIKEIFSKILPDSIKGWIKNALGIASPSLVFKQIGVHTIEGLAEGLNQVGLLERSMQNVASTVTGSFNPVVAGGVGVNNSSSSSSISLGNSGRNAGKNVFYMYGNIVIETVEAADAFFDRFNQVAEMSAIGAPTNG